MFSLGSFGVASALQRAVYTAPTPHKHELRCAINLLGPKARQVTSELTKGAPLFHAAMHDTVRLFEVPVRYR